MNTTNACKRLLVGLFLLGALGSSGCMADIERGETHDEVATGDLGESSAELGAKKGPAVCSASITLAEEVDIFDWIDLTAEQPIDSATEALIQQAIDVVNTSACGTTTESAISLSDLPKFAACLELRKAYNQLDVAYVAIRELLNEVGSSMSDEVFDRFSGTMSNIGRLMQEINSKYLSLGCYKLMGPI